MTHGMHETDILILGGGLAGLNARAEILEQSAGTCRVLLADAGGAASSEIMGFSAPANEPDSPELLFDDTMRAGHGFSDPALVRVLAERALPELRRLEQSGIVFDRTTDGKYDIVHALGTSVGRVVHSGTSTGRKAMELLKKDFPELEKRRAVKLLRSESGRIAGARFEDGSSILAKAVVLCGGGFAGLWKFSTWSKLLRGDALLLALGAGAKTTGLPFVQFEPTVTASGFPVITTVLNEGARLLDASGKNLLAPGGRIPAKRELAEIIQRAVDSGRGFPDGTVRYDFSGIDEEIFARRYPGYHLKFRRFCDSFRNLSFQVRPGAHTTLGGIRILPDCSVPGVPGLFAAGEATGGIHGRDRLGGNAGLEVFVFGRTAGKSALAFAEKNPHEKPSGAESEPDSIVPENYSFFANLLDCYSNVNSGMEDSENALKILNGTPFSPLGNMLKTFFQQKLEH